MKDKIMEILKAEIYTEQSGYLNGNCDIVGKEDAADKLSMLILVEIIEAMEFEFNGYTRFSLCDKSMEYLTDKGFTTVQIKEALNRINNK